MNSIKLYLSIIFVTISLSAFSQNDKVLMSVGDDLVTVAEFKYIYEKNNGEEANYSKESLEEYLDLYKKFKLKVQKAKELKIDTIVSLQEELFGYKRQLANSYLMEKDVTQNLIDQLYNRQKQDVRFSHILSLVPPNSTQRTIESALSRLSEARNKLNENQPWQGVVSVFSQDKNTINIGGDMGYFTAMLPNGFYEIENALYEANVGDVVGPIKSKIGYHLIKVTDKRAARREMEVAQILIRKKDNITAQDKISTVYNKLLEGMEFADAVKTYSEDTKFINAGGQLPVFGIGKYETPFEDAAFALVNDGDFSAPIETSIGWHILKKIRKHGELDYDRFKSNFLPKVKLDERFAFGKEHLLGDIRKAAFYKKNEGLLNKFVASLDDEFFTYRWKIENHAMMDNVLFSFGENYQTTLGEFAKFAKKNTRIRLRYEKDNHQISEPINALYDSFLEEKTLDFELKNLEARYPDFKSLMREYEEGILLFEVTKQAVWDRANQDSLGLQSFYEQHKSNYLSKENALVETYIISGADEKKSSKIRKYASKRGSVKAIKKYSKKGINVAVSKSELEIGLVEDIGLTMSEGNTSSLMEKDGSFTFSSVIKVNQAKPRPLADARGYVVADYQDYLEKEWVTDLEQQFSIALKEDVFSTLIR